MPGFLSRWLEWFRAKPTDTRALMIIIALVVAVVASPVLKWVVAAAIACVLVFVVVQVASRAPVRRWAIALGALVVAYVVFSAVAFAVYGPFRGSAPEQVQRAEETTGVPPTEPTRLEGPTVAQGPTTQPDDPTPQPEPSTQAADPIQPPVGVKITRVVDGDTVEISPPVDGKDTVRLIGIDAPEDEKPGCGAQPLAREAADQLDTWKGSKVKLEFDEDRTDQYGRLLAYVTAYAFGNKGFDIMLNEDQLLGGYAQLYIVPPNTKYEDRLREAQQQAKKDHPIFEPSIWTLSPAKQAQLEDHGNGIGKGDGACPSEPQSRNAATSTASSSASPNPSPNPNRNNNAPGYNNRNRNGGGYSSASSTASPSRASPSTEDCSSRGGHPVPPGTDGDGDGDGCAGEE